MVAVAQRKPPQTIYSIIQQLLKSGADVNFSDKHGNTALLLAMTNEASIRKAHIQLLLCHGARPDVVNNDGLTPLWQAVYNASHNSCWYRVIELLLSLNVNPNRSCRGQLLFTCGLNRVYTYENRMTPLEVALDVGNYSAARLLMLVGARVTSQVHHELLQADDNSGSKCLCSLLGPRSLLNSSRIAIRSELGTSLYRAVAQLPVPKMMKNYILMQEHFSDKVRVGQN